MSSKALYRKHRSRSFDDVVGQKHITDTLKQAIAKGAISHAYLFTGPKGVGKTSIARILAHAVNGLDYSDESSHLDIIEIDAASNRRIDEIRDLRDKVHIAPSSAPYKVYIIDEVHMLTREAFNALLKTLEEPPDHAIFILATTEFHKVPETIISRTQRFHFKTISTQDAIEHLKHIAKQEKITINDKALELLAEHGRGSFRDSISMLDQVSGMAKDAYTEEDIEELLGLPNKAHLDSLLIAIDSHNTEALFAATELLRNQGVGASQTARSLSALLRKRLTGGTLEPATVQLLKELLPLTNAQADYAELELAILSVFTQSVNQTPNVQAQAAETTPQIRAKPARSKADSDIKKEEPTQKSDSLTQETTVDSPAISTSSKNVKEAAENYQNNELTTDTAEVEEGPTGQIKNLTRPATSEAFSQTWQTLLNDIKGHHNTLYGILRMSDARLGADGTLELAFQFEFHRKRVQSAQHSKILKDYAQKYLGTDTVNIQLVANKKHPSMGNNSSDTAEPTAGSSDEIASVSNIFGGAELLE